MKKFTLFIISLCFFSTVYGQKEQNTSEELYTIKNLEINTEFQDYGVTLVRDSIAYFASSRRTKSIRNKNWQGNDQPFLQLYKGFLNENGEIEAPKLFSKKINSKYHDADLTFTKDLSTVYFTRNNYLNKKYKKDSLGRNLNQLYKATIDDKGQWVVQQMPFNNDHYQTGHPALSPNEDQLFFISDMPGGHGATDIYVVDILKNGRYSTPRNLGPDINTIGKEMFPFVDKNNLIYFASDGYEDGLGGLDIYVSKFERNSIVKKAQNIGKPFNSEKDDFAFVQQSTKLAGFFSSNRDGGKGDDDIYSFMEYDPLNFECNQLVTGIIFNKNSERPLANALVELFSIEGTLLSSKLSDKNGAYNFDLPCDDNYRIKASKQEFSIEETFLQTSKTYDFEHRKDLSLAPVEFVSINGKTMIKISPIFFELDKSDIREDAAEVLENVLTVMQKYPNINVKLGSHTDSRAGDEYNWELSKRRAKSTLEWLLNRGIDPQRITAKGYGEFELVNKCSNNVKCTEAEHQQNRRTEFIISNPEVLLKALKL